MTSGCAPERLGLYGFRHRTLGSYSQRYLADSRHVRAPRVWERLNAAGYSAGLLGVPQTFPVTPLSGFVVGDAPQDCAGLCWPEQLRDDLHQVAGPWIADAEGFRCADAREVARDIQQMTDQRFALLQHLLASRPTDFMMMVDMGADRMHHRFFRHCDPHHPLHAEVAGQPDPALAWYRKLDAHLERTLAALPDSTHVLVVSDHGARSLLGGWCVNDWLIAQGYLVLREQPRAARPFDESLVEWSRTRAWAWGGYHARVFINLQGREPQGIVAPEHLRALLDQLTGELLTIPGPGGAPLRHEVIRYGELGGGIAAQGDYPDLMVYFGELSFRAIGSVGHGAPFTPGNDTGPDDANHAPMGVFIHAGPGVRPGRREGMRLLDVAPAILSWFGL